MTIQAIPQRLSALKAPASSLAALAGVTGGQLSGYLNGSQTIPSHRLEELSRIVADFEKLAQLAAPLPLNFSDVNSLRECLDHLKEGRLRITVIVTEPTVREKAFAVQFSNKSFFQRGKAGDITATNSFFNAAMVTKSIADQLVGILASAGFPGCKVIPNQFASEDGPIDELAMVWQGDAVQASG